MSYDLLIGASPLTKHSSVIAGSIEFDEFTLLTRISELHRCWLFDRLLNFYEDQSFSMSELHQAVEMLDRIILLEKGTEERRLLYKISAIFSMAIRKDLPVHVLAD